jgi:hypothetical protein
VIRTAHGVNDTVSEEFCADPNLPRLLKTEDVWHQSKDPCGRDKVVSVR